MIDADSRLMCPLCGASFSLVEGKSLICEKSHCFDLSARGYVNFVPNQKQTFSAYPKELFKNRTGVFESGAYDKVASEICDLSLSYFGNGRKFSMLDAGCGEGFFAVKLSMIPCIDVLAVDISRDAIIAACKRKSSVKWMVADVTGLPIRGGGVDAILNMLSSANYAEFKRVLAAGGLIIKIVPGKDYLKEIRKIADQKLRNKEYSENDVAEYFEKHVKLVEKRALYYKWPVDAALFKKFTEMTPMTQGKNMENTYSGDVAHITIDLKILAGTPM